MKKAVVLLSGGIDSAVAAKFAATEGFELHALTINYGQRHTDEIACAKAQVWRLGFATHRTMSLGSNVFAKTSALIKGDVLVPKSRPLGAEGIPSTFVPGRNVVLLGVALGHAESIGANAVFVGFNADDCTGYPDCRPGFVSAMQTVADLALQGRVVIRTPLAVLTKCQVVMQALRFGIDLRETSSCYDPAEGGAPCRLCDACKLRAEAFRVAGKPDPRLEAFP